MNRFLFTIFFAGMALGFAKSYIPVIAKLTTTNPVFVGFAVGALTLSWPIFGIISGWLLDKYNRISVLTTTYTTYSIACFTLVLAQIMKFDIQILVIVFALISGIVVVIHENVYMTIPKDFAKLHELAHLNSRILLVDFLSGSLFGAALSSFFAKSNVIYYAFIVIAIAALVAGIICKGIILAPIEQSDKENQSSLHKNTLFDGFSHLINSPVLRNISILAFLLSFVFGVYQTLLIFFVTNKEFLNLPISYFGYVYAVYGMGIVFGSLFSAKFSTKLGLTLCVVLDVIGTAGLLLVPSFITNPYIVFVFICLAGAAVSFWFVSTSTIRQKITPNEILGKVNGAYRIFAYFGMPIGAFLCGFLLDFISIKSTSLIFGLGLLLLSIPCILKLNAEKINHF